MATTRKDITLIERYRQSNDAQRTFLFVSYPELRRDFMAIDLVGFRRKRGAD